MQIIPTQPLPNQTMQAQLGGQSCTVSIAQNSYGLFLSLYLGSVPVVAGAICQNLNRMVRNSYLGFAGDVAFVDTQGADDPTYVGLGSRFQLVYLEATDLPPGG